MVKRKQKFDEMRRLIRDRYYFCNFLILRYVISYPSSGAVATLYLFGIVPVWRFYLTSAMLSSGKILGGGGIKANMPLMLLTLWRKI
ncbi:hypothetical protein [Helicobacter sp. MIT 21-1697]|uniref:hypothetical protein n=1 Tax=Helicobacter sp. MIT 21-1697 TaxID=2993733 RepID=UPI00224B7A8F|nr:hypothetical protein [Helicobacter sp. MIT 21-1697]